ncbi:MAG: hypothetical protein GY950_24310 [bacterium]|nr:hypothetical protein [bacterium]
MKILSKTLLIWGILFLLLPLTVTAQAFMLEDWPTEKLRVTLKYLHPNVADLSNRPYLSYLNDLTFYSGVYDLSINLPISGNRRWNFEASMPLLVNNMKTEPIYWHQREIMIGELYLGLQYKLKSTPKKGTTISAGLYMGTTPDNNHYTYDMALNTNFVGFPKYQGDRILTTNIASYLAMGRFRIGWQAGLASFVSADNGYMDPILYIHYGFFGSYRFSFVTLRAELAGFTVIAGEKDHLNMSPNTNSVAVGANFGKGRIRPGIFYKRCLVEKYRREVKDVLGFQIQFLL